MKHLPTIARYLFALIFIVFGANKLIPFLPNPELSQNAYAFFGALIESGYMIPQLGLIELIVGLLLATNRFVPVALVVAMPISINIVLFHAFLDPATLAGPGLLVLIINTYLLFTYKKYFDPMLVSSATIGSNESE